MSFCDLPDLLLDITFGLLTNLNSMKTPLQNKIKLLVLISFALSLSAYSATGAKPNIIKPEKKQEIRSLKGACNCYKQTPVKSLNKYRKFQKRMNRSR